MQISIFIEQYNLQPRIDAALTKIGVDPSLFGEIATLPIVKSRAVRRFGSYVANGAEPVEIRLQFALETPELIETFLHELAHCLDHQTFQKGFPYRRAHGKGWRRWALALGISTDRCGSSETLMRLREERLKVVAVCNKCGFELRRLRRLPKKGRFIHTECGGKLRML